MLSVIYAKCQLCLVSFMLSFINEIVNYAECRKLAHYAECRYVQCRYAECHYAECRGAIL
jgi:hypothetical protein